MISRATWVPIERAADCTAERTITCPVDIRPRLEPPPFHHPPIVWPICPNMPPPDWAGAAPSAPPGAGEPDGGLA